MAGWSAVTSTAPAARLRVDRRLAVGHAPGQVDVARVPAVRSQRAGDRRHDGRSRRVRRVEQDRDRGRVAVGRGVGRHEVEHAVAVEVGGRARTRGVAGAEVRCGAKSAGPVAEQHRDVGRAAVGNGEVAIAVAAQVADGHVDGAAADRVVGRGAEVAGPVARQHRDAIGAEVRDREILRAVVVDIPDGNREWVGLNRVARRGAEAAGPSPGSTDTNPAVSLVTARSTSPSPVRSRAASPVGKLHVGESIGPESSGAIAEEHRHRSALALVARHTANVELAVAVAVGQHGGARREAGREARGGGEAPEPVAEQNGDVGRPAVRDHEVEVAVAVQVGHRDRVEFYIAPDAATPPGRLPIRPQAGDRGRVDKGCIAPFTKGPLTVIAQTHPGRLLRRPRPDRRPGRHRDRDRRPGGRVRFDDELQAVGEGALPARHQADVQPHGQGARHLVRDRQARRQGVSRVPLGDGRSLHEEGPAARGAAPARRPRASPRSSTARSPARTAAGASTSTYQQNSRLIADGA